MAIACKTPLKLLQGRAIISLLLILCGDLGTVVIIFGEAKNNHHIYTFSREIPMTLRPNPHGNIKYQRRMGQGAGGDVIHAGFGDRFDGFQGDIA